MSCKCNEQRCIGFVLLHEKELSKLTEIKQNIAKGYGEVFFDLKISPSSGELFTKFYELHVSK